jgi:hypothetical protein
MKTQYDMAVEAIDLAECWEDAELSFQITTESEGENEWPVIVLRSDMLSADDPSDLNDVSFALNACANKIADVLHSELADRAEHTKEAAQEERLKVYGVAALAETAT